MLSLKPLHYLTKAGIVIKGYSESKQGSSVLRGSVLLET